MLRVNSSDSSKDAHFFISYTNIVLITGFCRNVKNSLRSDGAFLGSLLGGENLFELRYLSVDYFKNPPY